LRSTRAAWPERRLALPILAVLALLAVAAWSLTAWQAHTRAMSTAGAPMSLDMTGRLGLAGAAFFFLVWLVMMAAMMFPSAWPAVLLYARAAQTMGSRATVVSFVAGYLLVWEGLGLLVYASYASVGMAVTTAPELGRRLPWLAGAVVACAGVYQLTPLKLVCLAHCQGPLGFFMQHWRSGAAGALRMGIAHGAYCLGCCWGLMLAFVALGAMDLRWMATVAALIAVEKLGPRRAIPPRVIGVALLVLGVLVAIWPRGGAMR